VACSLPTKDEPAPINKLPTHFVSPYGARIMLNSSPGPQEPRNPSDCQSVCRDPRFDSLGVSFRAEDELGE